MNDAPQHSRESFLGRFPWEVGTRSHPFIGSGFSYGERLPTFGTDTDSDSPSAHAFEEAIPVPRSYTLPAK
ncbi:MAG: hypothetical protein RLZZ165_693 [Bacteroidota bacterium]|jgi:hypothetical protein